MKNSTLKIVRIALGIQLFALMMLLVFRSDSFLSYAYDLPPNSFNSKIVVYAEIWDNQMNDIGIAATRNQVIEFVEMLHGEEEF